MNRIIIAVAVALIATFALTRNRKPDQNQNKDTMKPDTTDQYGYNVNFLKKHVRVVELRNGSALVALVPAWQGRVMTSSAEGEPGFSFGWINRNLISAGKILPHINAFGGEERMWLGPEGGQFSIFFKKGDPFVYDKWQTPAFIDTDTWDVTGQSESTVTFSHKVTIENYSGTQFNLGLERKVALLTPGELLSQAGINAQGLNAVAYRSENKLVNLGEREWEKETGLLSIWMLGMFNPSPSVVIAAPFKAGDESALGVPVNDNYFGKISTERLRIKGNVAFFRADGKSRGKIGIPPLRATGTMGSYDARNNILTLLVCRMPEGKAEYVNSAWEIQKNPYSGDAMNAYNDGPLADGSQMGPFYELEASSPAAMLKPGGSIVQSQVTIHLTGDKKLLNSVAVKVLGVSLSEIQNSFK
jgi:hypothetical protein